MTMSRALDIDTRVIRAGTARGAARAGVEQTARAFDRPLVLILTGLGVTALVVAAILFTRSSGLVAGLWGASGIAVAAWLRNSRSANQDAAFCGVLAVSILIGEILSGNAPVLSLLFTAGNLIEIVTAVFLARRFAPGQDLTSLEGAGRFLVSAAVLAPIPAGLFMSALLAMTQGGDFLEGFQTWWFGHALGIAVLGSLGLALTRRGVARLAQPSRMVEFGLLMLLVGFIYSAIYDGRLTFGFILLPLLMLTAVRLGVIGAATSLLIVAVMAVGSAMHGTGPYLRHESVADQVLAAQLLVLIGYIPMILLAALLDERDRLAERARLGQHRAERASEAKSRLLANVAHEIKSPVAGVIGIGELWSNGQLGPVTPRQAEMAEMLVKTARQVEALAHDLLDVARAESGAIKVDLRPTDVAGLLQDVRRAAELRPEAHAVTLEVACEGEGLIATADSQRLAQVLTNLTSNAIKYGGSGGRVVLRAARSDDCIRIEVVDFGPGLTPQKQAQLFEPFNRLGLERSSIEGHGVGLALAKRMVELQHGSIGVTSEVGQGAVFWVLLPRA
jgi:signal transduction histidine kinase